MASKLAATALLSLCAAAVAQATLPKVKIPLPDAFDDQEMVGSVIKADQATMVISLACPSPTGDPDDYECGLFPQQTLTWGPSTWKMDMAVPGDGAFTMTQDCKFFSANGSAVCTESAGGSEANFPGSSMEVYSSVNLMVTITGGYEKYKSANPTGTAFATASGSEGPVTGSGASQTLPIATPTGASGSSSGTPSASTGAAAATGLSRSFGAGVGLLAGLGLMF